MKQISGHIAEPSTTERAFHRFKVSRVESSAWAMFATKLNKQLDWTRLRVKVSRGSFLQRAFAWYCFLVRHEGKENFDLRQYSGGLLELVSSISLCYEFVERAEHGHLGGSFGVCGWRRGEIWITVILGFNSRSISRLWKLGGFGSWARVEKSNLVECFTNNSIIWTFVHLNISRMTKFVLNNEKSWLHWY